MFRSLVATHKERNPEVMKVYEAIQANDLAEAVLRHDKTAEFYDVMQAVRFIDIKKSEEISNDFRFEGNKRFKARNLQHALIFYNKALMFAPEQSIAKIYAYSNRSVLFLGKQLASACLKDINNCFQLACPQGLKDKLLDRMKQCEGLLKQEAFNDLLKSNSYAFQYFKFDGMRNSEIPCASADLEVIFENDIPKVVAKKCIKPGTVLAVEPAFVNTPNDGTRFYCCHYCNNVNLNLIPCPGCPHALYCNKDCMQQAMIEYHSIECQILNKFTLSNEPNVILAFRATLKIKNLSRTWQEFVETSYNVGESRLLNSSVNEIYDCSKPYSLLNSSDKGHFIYGKMYNSGAKCAFIIKKLDELVPTYFPELPEDKRAAISAFARIFLFLAVHGRSVPMVLSVSNSEDTAVHFNVGLFSFCGKLKMSCNANTLTVALNKNLALVAMQQIPAGAEITVPFLENWLLPDNIQDKNKLIFHLYETLCQCVNCIQKDSGTFKSKLDNLQIKTLQKFNISRMNENLNIMTVKEIFEKLCASMHVFNGLPYTECNNVYGLMRKCILLMQNIATDNKMLGDC